MTTPPAAPPSSPPVVKSTRGRKPGTVEKERPPIPADEFKLTMLSGKTLADRRRKREPRKPQQKQVDTIVYNIFEENKANGFDRGTIADWADLVVFDWALSMAMAENALFMIRKACMLYNRKPILGEQLEILANKSHMIENPEDPDNEIPCHMNGKHHIHIPFSVVRRRRKPVIQV